MGLIEPTGGPRPRTAGSIALSVAARLVPGIGRVRAQEAPFADAWRAANTRALEREAPLWVAMGDSMSQGIGARDISGGWVGQLHSRLDVGGIHLRLVNLSASGARVRDLLHVQLPRLRALEAAPALVTVLIGANDMVLRGRRAAAVATFEKLLADLPPGVTVIATLPRRNPQALAINANIDAAAASGRVRMADMRSRTMGSYRGTLADDHFHPNERGYAAIAAVFEAAIDLSALSTGST